MPKTAYERRISDWSSDVCSSDLVAAGFFSNIVLLDFDQTVIGQIGREVTNGVWLQDACRYVDDIRLTITTAPGIDPTEAQARVMAWLGQLLTGSCPGLEFSPEKTSTASVGGEQMPDRKSTRLNSSH